MSHYPTEEGEECDEEGGEVIGFGLRKLLTRTDEDEEEEGEGREGGVVKPKKRFSLDFPPGLVHDESECDTFPKRWETLKKLLQSKTFAKRKSAS